jgi:hypothetical protein
MPFLYPFEHIVSIGQQNLLMSVVYQIDNRYPTLPQHIRLELCLQGNRKG